MCVLSVIQESIFLWFWQASSGTHYTPTCTRAYMHECSIILFLVRAYMYKNMPQSYPKYTYTHIYVTAVFIWPLFCLTFLSVLMSSMVMWWWICMQSCKYLVFGFHAPYIYIHTCMQIYIHTYIHRYVHTYIRTCIHTYIYTYVLTYIHTCIHTYTSFKDKYDYYDKNICKSFLKKVVFTCLCM
jgi:hypothetical protein